MLSIPYQLRAYAKAKREASIPIEKRPPPKDFDPALMAHLKSCSITMKIYNRYRDGLRLGAMSVSEMVVAFNAHRAAIDNQINKLEKHGFVVRVRLINRVEWVWVEGK